MRYLQSDGYGGIAPLFTGASGPNKVGCNDHRRRKFVDALKLRDSRAGPVVALCGQLYAVEREAKHMSPAERLVLRRARSVALWDALRTEVARLEPLADPKSPLGKASTYFRRQQAALRAFLDDGELPISKAHVERLIRTVALFRKNSLFVGSLEAGQRYATLLTIAVNCTLVGANPFTYFTDVLHVWPPAGPSRVLPTSCRSRGSPRSKAPSRSRATAPGWTQSTTESIARPTALAQVGQAGDVLSVAHAAEGAALRCSAGAAESAERSDLSYPKEEVGKPSGSRAFIALAASKQSEVAVQRQLLTSRSRSE